VTRKRSDDKTLPAAEIDEGVLRDLERAIPQRWLPVVTWWVVRSSLEIQHANVEDLLDEVSEEEGIDAVGFSIFENPQDPELEVYFQLWCDSDGCGLEYRSPDDDQVWGALSLLAQRVDEILRSKRRYPWFRAARISLGKDARTSRSRLSDWKGVSQNIIAGIVSGVIVGIIMLFVGIAIG